jgi:hypothetical protein
MRLSIVVKPDILLAVISMYILYVPKNLFKALWFKVSLRPVAMASNLQEKGPSAGEARSNRRHEWRRELDVERDFTLRYLKRHEERVKK